MRLPRMLAALLFMLVLVAFPRRTGTGRRHRRHHY